MEEILKFASDNSLWILIAVVTSNIGAFARISYEKESKKVSIRQSFKYYSASWVVSYICMDALLYFEKPRLIGIFCMIGGLISVDLIKLLIEKLPGMIGKRLNKEITGEKKL